MRVSKIVPEISPPFEGHIFILLLNNVFATRKQIVQTSGRIDVSEITTKNKNPRIPDDVGVKL